MEAWNPSYELTVDDLTTAKYHAMKKEATTFYSQKPRQAWTNILSFGDGVYEYHAVQEVSWRYSCSRNAQCRTKTVLLPQSPTIGQLTLTLRLFQLQLPVFVNFDGDIDINLQKSCDPWMELAVGLRMTDLARISFPSYAWRAGSIPPESEITAALDQVALAVQARLASLR